MVRLRAIEPEDADAMYEMEEDEAAWRYSDYLAPLSKELLRHYALTYDADPYRSGQLRLIIENDDRAIGTADLFDISPRHLRSDTGIYILPRYRDRGLGTRALQLLKEFARERLGLHQLTATVAEENTAALNAFVQAGFDITGKRQDWIRGDQGYENAILLSTIL